MAASSRMKPLASTDREGPTAGLAGAVDRMRRYRHHGGLVMWVLLGGAVAGVAVLLAVGAPPGWLGAIFGIAIVACLLVCVGSAWVGARSTREVSRAVDELKARRGSR